MPPSNENAKTSKRTRRFLIFLIAAVLIAISSTYFGFRIWIKSDITQICENAMNQYPGDKIEAMISFLNSDSQSLEDKNKTIWALGKLNDQRALPILKSLQTGTECNHSEFVCQRELKKAIDNLEGKNVDLFSFR
ncbi:hypothetical protein ACUNWD_18575 [Sunxiuqinia sp. A32]|uniref:hypothetical protein n=1 Tax=Sunxiuqinia sp. A32 TaxID=3461496 RepID=UPI004046655D